MSFENLDNQFEKIAQTPRKTDIKSEEDRQAAEVEDKTKYETTFESSGLTGLLAAFQEKLKNRDPNRTEGGSFETINLTSVNVGPTTPQGTQADVSEEQIDTLLKKKPTDVSENIEVEQTVSKHTRYEDTNPTTETFASRDDLNTTPQQSQTSHTPQSTYGQSHQVTDDEVQRQLIKHNQQKADKKAAENQPSDEIENS